MGTPRRGRVRGEAPGGGDRHLSAGESVQWEVLDRGVLHLVRQQPPQPSAKGTRHKQTGKPAESPLPGA